MGNKRKLDETEDDLSQSVDESELMVDEEGGIKIDDIYVPPPPIQLGQLDVNGPRLIITKIVNNNFKSYGTVQTVGPFHKNFNAIVGPNGSGKSNVIDSLLFVFGYRASKIRSKKLSVLLHKSAKYQNVESCTVSIHFTQIIDKENDEFELIPNTEFVVSRTAHKDNSSYYQVDNKRMQYKEISCLLRKHGIDLDHNRFLILQGEVEQISLMKPKAPSEHETGMLEYLEDIIGTTRFRQPIIQLNEKIEIFTEQRSEKLNRVQRAQKEKDDLKKPMLEAIKYIELENEITFDKNKLYQKHLHEYEKEFAYQEEAQNNIVNKYQELKETIADVLKKKKHLENNNTEEFSKLENLKDREYKLQATFDQADLKDKGLQKEIVRVNSYRKKAIEDIKINKKKIENYKQLPETSKRDIEDYQTRQIQLEKDLEKYETKREKILSDLSGELTDIKKKNDNLHKKRIELMSVVDEVRVEYNSSKNELENYIKKNESNENEIPDIKIKLEEATKKVDDCKQTMKNHADRLPAIEKSLKQTNAELHLIKTEEPKIYFELDENRKEYSVKQMSLQANKSKGRVLDTLTQLHHEGKLPGFCGRLGDLGGIDDKYNTAISACCPGLDFIIVDTISTARWCLAFLKKHNIGRGTFLALDEQEHLTSHTNTSIKTPENLPRLFNLVKVHENKYRNAFYYALRNTIVANDLNQATRVAYGTVRWRVVTLKGEVIELAGTMSGGGKEAIRSRIGKTVLVANSDVEFVEKLEARVNNLEQKYMALKNKKCALESQIETGENEFKKIKNELERNKNLLPCFKEEQKRYEKRLEELLQLKRNKVCDPNVKKQLEKNVEKTNAKLEKTSESVKNIETQIEKFNNDIKKITDDKMNGLDEKIAQCKKILQKCKKECLQLKTALVSNENNLKNAAQMIENLEETKADAEKRLLEMKTERGEIEKDATVILQHIETIKEEISKAEEEIKDQKKKIDKMFQSSNEMKKEQINIETQMNEIKAVVKQKKQAIGSFKNKLSKLIYQEIPNKDTPELENYTPEQLDKVDIKTIETNLTSKENVLKEQKPNLNSIKEYNEKENQYLERVQELDVITEKRKQMRDFLDNIRKKRQAEFHNGFNLISIKLKEMYQMITLGGDAELEMVDSYDPFSEGVILNVRPPRKSWKNITNLSGGEKTLSSLALVFALHYYKPSPLYFMDEIDAALDFKNVSIVGNYIKERTKNAQFIIISLRSNMFELANYLIGIYKTYDITKCVTLDPSQYMDKKNVQNNGNQDKNEEMNDSTHDKTMNSSNNSLISNSLNNVNQENGITQNDSAMDSLLSTNNLTETE